MANISTSEMSHLIDEWIFNEKYRFIIKRKLIDKITFEALAEEVDMSVRQVKNIVCNGKNIISLHENEKPTD